uniref:Reverse transcriptase domain-containing protein n=1 Tax=Tanacetum cinerariifolium TaxID=118510 RepID=A0A6L2NHR6_TANCI|nr:reverse transcriptase domain-containing protein [Tanacetum cinerariifolium]
MDEAHTIRYYVQSGADKVYYDIRDMYWWPESVGNEIRYEYGLSSLDRWAEKCRSLVLWAEIRESRLIGPKMIQETTDKVVQIKEMLKTARDRQKSYKDNRRKPLEFSVGGQVLLKVSP